MAIDVAAIVDALKPGTVAFVNMGDEIVRLTTPEESEEESETSKARRIIEAFRKAGVPGFIGSGLQNAAILAENPGQL